MPVTVVVGLAHDLREPLLETRLLLADRAHLASARFATPLQRLIDRPLQRSEHMFVCYPHPNPESVPRLCRNTAHSSWTRKGPGEVLVSSTFKDLVVGSGLSFDDRGTHPLKGVPDAWHLYALASAPRA